jgi:NAD(P)-dependent dehydrogenase (short-subunit alcohol dehydrogenase family)
VNVDAFIVPLDVTDRAQCDVAVREAIERFGHVDVLVNTAGVGHFAAIEPSAPG